MFTGVASSPNVRSKQVRKDYPKGSKIEIVNTGLSKVPLQNRVVNFKIKYGLYIAAKADFYNAPIF